MKKMKTLDLNNTTLNQRVEKTKVTLIIKKARKYEEFNLNDEPIYTQYENDREKFLFVANPMLKLKNWGNFIP